MRRGGGKWEREREREREEVGAGTNYGANPEPSDTGFEEASNFVQGNLSAR